MIVVDESRMRKLLKDFLIQKDFRVMEAENGALLPCIRDFPGAQKVKYLAAVQETRIQSLGQEDPLEKGMATHRSIVAWKIPWTAEPGGLQPMGFHRGRPN